MKSQVDTLLYAVRGLCEDIRAAYPALKGLSLDLERIALGCRNRGLAFFTLDLPNLDTILLGGLESGRLAPSGPCSHMVSRRVRVPRLGAGLWLRIFDKDANLRQDADPSAIAFLRQLSVIGKKLEVGCSESRRDDAIRSYHNVERSLRMPTLRWEEDEIDACRASKLCLGDAVRVPDNVPSLVESVPSGTETNDLHLLRRCQLVADIVIKDFPFCDPVALSVQLEQEGKGLGFKHGPGAVAERLRNWNKSQFPYWPHKLESWFPFDLCARSAGDDRKRPLNHEVAARLLCVPKTSKGPRIIAAEPVAHQWCQQATWSWLRRHIRSSLAGLFVDFGRQDLSGALVIQASLDRKLATVDLSDASDRLSCWTVERMFRGSPSLLSVLHAARTRYLRYDSRDGSSFIKLKKFASQGTATTFPGQSLVFLIIALTASLGDGRIDERSIRRLRNQVRVFGDDIILPRHGYPRLLRLMELLQLKVNMAKSYVRGHFRESCGTDGYMGVDVTPVKPRTIVCSGPKSYQAVLDTANNLFLKGFWRMSDAVLSSLPRHVLSNTRVVKKGDEGFSGLRSFSGSCEAHLRSRWNPRLHRWESRVWSSQPKPVSETRGGFSAFVDFCSRPHNPDQPRIVSEYASSLGPGSRLRWDLRNSDARQGVSHK